MEDKHFTGNEIFYSDEKCNNLGAVTSMEYSLVENFRKLSREEQLLIYSEIIEILANKEE